MTEAAGPEIETLRAVERVVHVLAGEGVDSALIGAVALAAHGYPRSTEDVDLAVAVDPTGFTVEVSEPDGADPLGGVLRVGRAGLERIEIVNFLNPPAGGFAALAEAALRDAVPTREGSPLRVVTLPHLVLFKLYAGGPKSRQDVLELLGHNPDVDLEQLREACRRFRLDRKLDAWLRALRELDVDDV